MHQPAHACRSAGPREFLCQFDMGFLERCGAAVQDRDQVDDRVMPGHEAGEGGFVVHVGLHRLQQRQAQDVPRVVQAPGGHGDAPAQAGELFADMAANKAGAAENQDFFHGWNVA